MVMVTAPPERAVDAGIVVRIRFAMLMGDAVAAGFACAAARDDGLGAPKTEAVTLRNAGE